MEAIVDATDESGSGASTQKMALSQRQYLQFVDEIRSQPNWRSEADRAADYYDGNQLTQEELAELNRQKLGSLMANFIKPSVDTVLGIEAKMRQDWKVAADDDQWQDTADALSAKLHEAERMTRADRACSEAYAGQIKAGLHWVEVSRNVDPFKYPYRVNSIHRREMFWDWSAKEPDLDDARYIARRKWYPVEQAAMYLPKSAELIKAAASGWSPEWLDQAKESAHLMNAFEQESRTSVNDWDWRNLTMNRVSLTEMWYPVYVSGYVLTLPDERTVEFDRKNPVHVAAVAQKVAQPRKAVYRKMRASIWLGPHCLQDIDVGGNKCPYVPFWGFREDLTGVPYGLVRAMIPLQDEINRRRQRLMWLLQSKRVVMDGDALDKKYNTFEDILDEVNRPDSVIVLNSGRANKQGAITVESDMQLAAQQFEVLVEAKEGIQSVAGIFNSMMGKTDGAKSGLAINALVEQGSNTMGEINDNFRYARNLVGERLLALIREDLSGSPVTVMSEEKSGYRRNIMLNTPAVDPATGIKYRENDVSKAQVKVVLEDVPSTPTYRAQQMQQIAEVLKGMPPEMSGVLIPFFIENTDLKDRKEMARLLRAQLGLVGQNGEPVDPQVAALQQQLQAMQEQANQMADAYEQAVKEQSDKAQQLGQQLNELRLKMVDRGNELLLKKRELDQQRMQQEADAIRASKELRIREMEAQGKLQGAQEDRQIKRAVAEHTIDKGEHGMQMAEEKQQVESVTKGADMALRMHDQSHAHGMAKRQQAHTEARAQIDDVNTDAERAHQDAATHEQRQHETEQADKQAKREDQHRAEDRKAAVQDQTTARNAAVDDRNFSAKREDDSEAKRSEVEKIVKAAVAEAVKPLQEQIKQLKARKPSPSKAK